MNRSQIQKAFDMSDGMYKKISETLGENGEIPGTKMADFEVVMGWFQAEPKLTTKDAIERYKNLHPESPASPADLLAEAHADRIEEAALIVLEELNQNFIPNMVRYANSHLLDQVMIRVAQMAREKNAGRAFPQVVPGQAPVGAIAPSEEPK